MNNRILKIILFALLCITFPQFSSAMDLANRLEKLSSSLQGLKGKLNGLQGGLKNLKGALDGSSPAPKPAPKPTEFFIIPQEAVDLINKDLLTGLGQSPAAKTHEPFQRLLKIDKMPALDEEIEKLSPDIKNKIISVFDAKSEDLANKLKAQGLSADQVQQIVDKGTFIVQTIEAQNIANKLMKATKFNKDDFKIKSNWADKDAAFKGRVIYRTFELFYQKLLSMPSQERIKLMVKLDLLANLKDDASIKKLAKDIAKVNKSGADVSMSDSEFKKLQDLELPIALIDFKDGLGIDFINQQIQGIIIINNKPQVTAGGPPPFPGNPTVAPLSKEDFKTIAKFADYFWGSSDSGTGFFADTIKNGIKTKIQKSLNIKQTTNVDEITEDIDPKVIDVLKQSLGIVKVTVGGSGPKPTGPKPAAAPPAGYEDVWDKLVPALANPIAFKNSINDAISKIDNAKKMTDALNGIGELHNLLIAMDSNRPEAPAVHLLKNWKPVFKMIKDEKNPAIKAWFVEQMKKNRATSKGVVVYTGNPDFTQADWDKRVNAVLAVKKTVKKPSGPGAGPSDGSGVSGVSGLSTGGIDLLEIPNFEDFYIKFRNDYFAAKLEMSRFGKERGMFGSHYTNEIVDNIKDYISRACFEKNILELCKKFIDAMSDVDKTEFRKKPIWVYENYLQAVIQSVLDNGPSVEITALLNETADLAVQSVNDMFYHKERKVGGDQVGCDCLTDSLEKRCYTSSGVTSLPEAERIPADHPLYNPIQYLIFETMHITLFHGFHFINKLIPLFDFTKDISADVSVKDKTEFRIGFDNVFEKIMNYIVQGDDSIRAGLMFGTQKKFDGAELILVDGKPREVFYGARAGYPSKPDEERNITKRTLDYYWCQTGTETFPDGVRHSTTSGYQNYVTDDELRYAIKYHLARHTCYSVGLIPYNLVHMFKLPPEKEADVLEIIAEASNNEKEKRRLKAKAKGLRRVPVIVNYLANWKPGKINLAGAVGQKKAADSFRTYLENMMDTSGSVKILTSITQDEWMRVFDILSKLAPPSEGEKPSPQYEVWINKILKVLDNAEVRALLTAQLQNTKHKDPAKNKQKQVTKLIFKAFDANK